MTPVSAELAAFYDRLRAKDSSVIGPFADWLDEYGDKRGGKLRKRYELWLRWQDTRENLNGYGDPTRLTGMARRLYRNIRYADERFWNWVEKIFPEAFVLLCQHAGCTGEWLECDPLDGESEPERFCRDHLSNHGYCKICRVFWGGISSFEVRGICDHCHNALEQEDERKFDEDVDTPWDE